MFVALLHMQVALTYYAVVFVSYSPLLFSSSLLRAAGGFAVVVTFTVLVICPCL